MDSARSGDSLGDGTSRPAGRMDATKGSKELTTSKETAKSAKGRLAVTPGSVNFEGIVAGTVYSMLVRIQNVSKQSCRVRINPAASSKFKVTLPKGGAIAPGLEVVADVEFNCTEDVVRYVTSSPTLFSRSDGAPLAATMPLHVVNCACCYARASVIHNVLVRVQYCHPRCRPCCRLARAQPGVTCKISSQRLVGHPPLPPACPALFAGGP
jgi:hypothetical protein